MTVGGRRGSIKDGVGNDEEEHEFDGNEFGEDMLGVVYVEGGAIWLGVLRGLMRFDEVGAEEDAW